MNSIKSIVASAMSVLNNDELSNSLKSVGRTIKATVTTRENVVTALVEDNKAASFLSAHKELSTSTDAQRKAMLTMLVSGIGAHELRLWLMDGDKLSNDLKSAKAKLKQTKDEKLKVKFAKIANSLVCTINERNAVSKLASSEMRDLASMVVSKYKAICRQEALQNKLTSKEANKLADELGYKLKTESGFSIKLTGGEKQFEDTNKDSDTNKQASDTSGTSKAKPEVVLTQQAKNLLTALQGYEEDLPLTSKQFNAMVSYLEILVAPKH